jgi:hypothetical protein
MTSPAKTAARTGLITIVLSPDFVPPLGELARAPEEAVAIVDMVRIH